MLTPQQVSQYETFGVVIPRGLLSAEELKSLRAKLDHMARVADGYESFDGTEWQTFSMLVDDTSFAASLPEDPRFLGPAEQRSFLISASSTPPGAVLTTGRFSP